jgi:hypothetical protein
MSELAALETHLDSILDQKDEILRELDSIQDSKLVSGVPDSSISESIEYFFSYFTNY